MEQVYPDILLEVRVATVVGAQQQHHHYYNHSHNYSFISFFLLSQSRPLAFFVLAMTFPLCSLGNY